MKRSDILYNVSATSVAKRNVSAHAKLRRGLLIILLISLALLYH